MKNENKIVWCEIPVIDFDRALNFYSRVFGYELKTAEYEGIKFAMFDLGDDSDSSASGCIIKDGNRPSADGTLVYLNMNGRLDEAIEEVKKFGGKILMDKEQIGPWGYRVVILDTEGNKVAFHSF